MGIAIALLAGYKQQHFNGLHAYPRYAKHELKCISGAKLKACSNLNAGGAIWSWTWSGKQFINTLDYGRLIQSSLGQLFGALPTEGGDMVGGSGDYRNWHGSPLHSHTTSPGGTTQSTRGIPLEWKLRCFNKGHYDASCAGSSNIPVIYHNWRLGKNLSFDLSSINLGSQFNYLVPQIARYETVFYTPHGIKKASIEIPTGYLNPEFNRFFTIDASVSDLNVALTEITKAHTAAKAPSNHYQFDVKDAGGVVIATSDLKYAMGVYAYQKSLKTKGSIYFTLFNFLPSTTKWAAAYSGELPRGEQVFTSYIITGALSNVRVAMRRLYMAGYH